MTNMAHSAESLFIENQLSHQAKLRKPDLEYDYADMDETITSGYNCMSPCAGTFVLSKSTDKTSIFTSLWAQKPDEMIDPTQQDFWASDANNNETLRKESKRSDFSDSTECIKTKITQKMNRSSENKIKVSTCIVFSKGNDRCGFQGKIFISNISEDYVTYRVCSTNAQKFRYFPDDIGWIAPNGRREIFVQTNRMEAINFEDIASEVFKIQGATVCRKEQLDMSCLNTLWKSFGTEMFPGELCEEHLIDDVYPKENNYLDNFSLLQRFKFAFFKKIKAVEEPPASCSECSFYEHWPVNSQSYTVIEDQKQRTDVVTGTIDEIEKKKKSISRRLAYVGFFIAASVGISAVTYALFYDPKAFYARICTILYKCTKR